MRSRAFTGNAGIALSPFAVEPALSCAARVPKSWKAWTSLPLRRFSEPRRQSTTWTCWSRAALNAAGRSLAIDLAPRGIAVGLLHPGDVRTDMTGGRGNVEASEAAQMLVERIDELNAGNSGSFRHANGEAFRW